MITGSSGLLGKYLAKELSVYNCNLILVDKYIDLELSHNRNVDSKKILSVECDITSCDSIKNLMNKSTKKFKEVDALINCAALNDSLENNISKNNFYMPESYESFMELLKINVGGTYNMCCLIGEHMIKNGKGTIVNIASTYGITSPDQEIYKNKKNENIFIKGPAYPISKASVIHLTKYLAVLWAETKLTINCLSPGGILNNQDSDFVENYSTRCPKKRMSNTSDYLSPILFLISDTTPYMTGSNIVVDGGWTII